MSEEQDMTPDRASSLMTISREVIPDGWDWRWVPKAHPLAREPNLVTAEEYSGPREVGGYTLIKGRLMTMEERHIMHRALRRSVNVVAKGAKVREYGGSMSEDQKAVLTDLARKAHDAAEYYRALGMMNTAGLNPEDARKQSVAYALAKAAMVAAQAQLEAAIQVVPSRHTLA